MQLIHVQTQITTVLGWLDDDNVTETVTLQGQPENLTDEAWVDVARGLREKRAELIAEREAAPAEPEGNGQPANREQRRAAAKRARPKAKR